MKIVLMIVGMAVCFFSFAQTPRGNRGGQQMTGRLYGKVVDVANKGIEAASVTLVKKQTDSVTKASKEIVVGGMLSTPKGDFSIENVPAFGRYTLRVTGIGYKPFEQAVSFQMPNRNAGNTDATEVMGALDKDLGNIKLQIDDKTLSAVTVTASKPLLQMGIDRKVFNVDKNIVSAGGSAVDVMKNVPSVSVDIDGNVTLRNATPQIFVDGRPTNLTLEQIPADAIESVEVITNPSAKFDASGGGAGMLNIVLKKNKKVGYSGNVRANVDSRGRLGAGGDFNIRQNKVNFFASGNFNQRKSVGTGTTSRTTFGDTISNSLQQDHNNMSGAFGFGRAGFDFLLDNRNTVTVSGTYASGKMKPYTNSDITIDSIYNKNGNDTALNWYNHRISNSVNNFKHYGYQLSYKHTFPKTGHELTADANYQSGSNSNTNLIQTDYYRLPEKDFDHAYRQQQLGNGTNSNLILQTDYTNPLTDNAKLELGARAARRKVNSATDYLAILPDGRAFHLPGQNIVYNSEDRVYAAYATFSNRIGKFGYQTGLRAESSNYQGILPVKNETFNIKFPISLFPSIFLNDKLSDNDELQLNYSRRINRPNFWQLFPFTDYSDSLNISRGNPDLKPEFTNSFELSYSKTFKNRDNFIASIYFKNTNDLITRYQRKEVDTIFSKNPIFVNTYINANRSYVTGLELIGRNAITKWWDITSNINLFTAKINLDTLPTPNQFISYFLKINNTFKLPKNFSIQLSADYQSKIISAPGGSGSSGGGRGGFGGGASSTAQGFIRPSYGVDAAIRYDFLKNKAASLSLNVNDIFRTKKYDVHTESTLFSQDAVRRRDWQVFRLNFNYRFGKFDANLFKRKNTKAENDTTPDNANY